MRGPVAGALALALLGACQEIDDQSVPDSGAPMGLEGSRWRLEAIQSMDDAQGTTRPADPASYTLAFGRDGRLSARLDCNRGTGPWTSEPADATGGSLAIGPLAMTRAMCPPPSLGDKVARDLGYVRSYVLQGGRLYTSLMADGGILVWVPDPAAR